MKSYANRRQDLQSAGVVVMTKVYQSSVIPDQKEYSQVHSQLKKNYRPNNFMAELPYQQALNAQQMHMLAFSAKGHQMSSPLDLDDQELLEIELTGKQKFTHSYYASIEDEFNYAVQMTDQSIRRLTKAHIVELRSNVKPPHPLVEKVISMVCILRGCVAPNWTTAREMMMSMTFKMELMLMDPRQIKGSLIKRVIKILNQNQKTLIPDVRFRLSANKPLAFRTCLRCQKVLQFC